MLSSHFSEYYFSPRNLGKDIFLRRQMAKDGSVMLGLVASFQRVQSLTQDFNLLLEVGVYFCIFLVFFVLLPSILSSCCFSYVSAISGFQNFA